MDKIKYMKRLARWAHWFLPRAEAEDVLGDYQLIVDEPDRSERDLLREVGEPYDVMRSLRNDSAYRRWLAVFAILCACILLPGLAVGLNPDHYSFWGYMILNAACIETGMGPFCLIPLFFAAAGLIGAFIWKYRSGERGTEKIQPRLVQWLAVTAAASFSVIAMLFYIMNLALSGQNVESYVASGFGFTGYLWWDFYLRFVCTASALIGVFGLVQARVQDRRWVALYVLALAAMLIAIEALAFCTRLSDPAALPMFVPHFILIAAVGLVGMGVALC